NTSGADFEITILDALGKVVYSASLLSSDSAKISTDTLPRGIYIVTLKGAMISETKRLVKN
ncbi:MAG: T9SS C-terminal target domain-containing protein, partial [Sphingobacteriia bacterium]|nr:T9SS C-terminal target domain-containing protein [Sphingobacteriia bacterium]